jgi:hypothetical protein
VRIAIEKNMARLILIRILKDGAVNTGDGSRAKSVPVTAECGAGERSQQGKRTQCGAIWRKPMQRGNVIEMKRRPDVLMYLSGKTLRSVHLEMGGNPEYLFDTDGTPVLESEFYEVTPAGIKRVA